MMVVDSDLVRRVERMLENLPIKGFETALHVLVVIAALKERNTGTHLTGEARSTDWKSVPRVGLKNLFIPTDEHRIAALAPITVRSERKGGKKM